LHNSRIRAGAKGKIGLVENEDKKNNGAEAELRKAGLVTGFCRAFAGNFRAGCSRKTSSKKRLNFRLHSCKMFLY